MTTFMENQSQTPGLLALEQESPQNQAVHTEKTRRKYIRGSRPARVTKISIEQFNTEIAADPKPRLKTGVQISVPIAEIEKSLIIATLIER